jgi:hypothetical protein
MTKFATMFCALILSAAATPALADCALDAKAMVSGMVKLPPFHLSIKTTSGNLESRMTGDVILPDNFRLVFGNSSMIMTPRGTWMFDKGKWKVLSQDAALNMQHVLLSGLTEGLASMRNVRCNAKAKINGKVYKSIEFDTYKNPKDKMPLAHMTYYLNGKGQPLWIITQGHTAKGNSAVVQQFTYDPSIKIEDPK